MLTNNLNAPQALFEAIKNDPYSKGDADISVTQLINPPQMRVLWKRHEDKIDVDVVERFWAACGKAMHLLLANHTSGGRILTEHRMNATMEGWVVSGQLDLFDQRTMALSDYKFVGQFAYKMALQQGKPEWEAQANIYRWLLAINEKVVAEKLEIVCLMRDWMASQRTRAGYPPAPWGIVRVPVWSLEQTEHYVRERVRLHQKADALLDEHQPSCSDEERWLRDGKPLRCNDYCQVRSVCHQAKMDEVKNG